ncbi:acyl carrier protein [Ignavibacterium album]|uniref:acyl carrier protein n=1 Tax=Ignavibacterium album TaxID=591197 RepID=UPI0035B6B17B
MISDKLKEIILRELNLTDYPLSKNTVASDVPGWDSLKMLSIIMTIEDEFNIHFMAEEIVNLSNVGDLQNLIEMKLNT